MHETIRQTKPDLIVNKYGIIWFLFTLALTESLLFNGFQEEEIKGVGQLVMNCGQIPGMSVAVVKGSELWTHQMGVKNVSTKNPVKESTNFVIASLTKAFTSTLLIMLLKESKEGYTVDTPLKDILKRDDLFSNPERSREATVKDILSHRMGLARADLALFAGYPDHFRLQNLSRALSCLPVMAPFRDRFIYSNFMYSLAGHVIEKLTNQSYSDVLHERILKPVGMMSTLTSYNFSHPQDAMAHPYMSVGGKVEPVHHSLFKLPVFLPALGLASNARDMALWLQTILSQGRSPSGDQIIPPEVVAMTQYPVTPYTVSKLRPRYPQPELTFAYGLGWFQSVYKGFRRIWHAGSLYGFTSIVWIFPDVDIAVFATTNGPARTRDTKNYIKMLLSYIVDPLLGFPPWIDQSTTCLYSSFTNPQQQQQQQQQQRQQQQQQHQHQKQRRSLRPKNDNNGGSNEVVDSSCRKINQSYVYSTAELEKYTGIFYNKLFGQVKIQLIDTTTTFPNKTVLQKTCPNNNNTNSYLGWPPFHSKILKITFGVRFSGILHPTAEKNLFQMEPTGVFEFSAHPQENQETTMPVQFIMTSDLTNAAKVIKVKAVWQAVEMIQYSRGGSDGCFSPSIHGSGEALLWNNAVLNNENNVCLLIYLLLVTLCIVG